MATMIGGRVHLIRGSQVDSYNDELELVKSLVGNSSLGAKYGHCVWGGKEHIAAMYEVRDRINDILQGIHEAQEDGK